MDIRISKESEVPLRQQLAEQIVFHIATGKIQPGEALPSVRELARRLKIHHDAVERGLSDLSLQRMWLVGRRGSRVTVRAADKKPLGGAESGLDDLHQHARSGGARTGPLAAGRLRERVRERLLAQPPITFWWWKPTRVCAGCCREEMRAAINWPVEVCYAWNLPPTPASASARWPWPRIRLPDVNPLLHPARPALPLAFARRTSRWR